MVTSSHPDGLVPPSGGPAKSRDHAGPFQIPAYPPDEILVAVESLAELGVNLSRVLYERLADPPAAGEGMIGRWKPGKGERHDRAL
jgi:hypothetical protein